MWPLVFPGPTGTAQVSIVGIAVSTSVHDLSHVEAAIQRLLQLQGPLFAFKKQIPLEGSTFRAVAEFCDISAAAAAMANCGDTLVDVGA